MVVFEKIVMVDKDWSTVVSVDCRSVDSGDSEGVSKILVVDCRSVKKDDDVADVCWFAVDISV